VSPIDHEDMEAVRGTQKGARLLHEARVEEAIREFHAVCNRVPRSAPARCNLGAAYFERGDEDAALHWFREAYRLDERSSRILRAVAVLEQRAGNFSEALWLLRNYLQEVDEFNMQVQHQLACLHRERHQWAQAAACYRKLLKADPSNRDYARELQSCLDRAPLEGDLWARGDRSELIPQTRSERSSELILRGPNRSLQMEKYARAPSQEVRPWDARGPDRGRGGAECRLGSADRRSGSADRRGRFSSADRRMASADRRAGSADGRARGTLAEPGLNLQQAEEQRASGNLQQAYAMYRKILDADGSNVHALRGVVRCLLETGHGRTAQEAARRLQAAEPSDAEANLLLAEALLCAGQAPAAERPLAVASARPVASLRSRILQAQAKVALFAEDFKKAMSMASEAVRMEAGEAGDVKALLALAEVRIQFADYEAALRALGSAEQALRNESRKPVARTLLAQTCGLAARAQERLRRFPEALEEARRATELDPTQGPARLARAMALQQTGRLEDAEMELRELLRHQPKDCETLTLLGYLQLSSGSSAIPTLQEAVSQSNTSPTRKSLAGAARVYLALALDAHELGDNQLRAEQLVREGLPMHRNLEHVWRAQERLLPQQQPPYTSAVQQLRGICDLDLTTLQARRLLALLARSSGRHGLVRPLATTGACGSRTGSMPPPNRQWVPSRQGSQAPTPSDRRSLSPMGYSSGQVPMARGHGERHTRSREPPSLQWSPATDGLGGVCSVRGTPSAPCRSVQTRW